MRAEVIGSRAFATGTTLTESFSVDIVKDFAFSNIVEALTATNVQVILQESPSRDTVADGAAMWLDLVTLGVQAAVGGVKLTNATPCHKRKRVKVIVTGAGAATIRPVMEGQRMQENDYR